MANLDGTGPNGQGPRTGNGRDNCGNNAQQGGGRGRCGCSGGGRGFNNGPLAGRTDKKSLEVKKEILQEELKAVEEALKSTVTPEEKS